MMSSLNRSTSTLDIASSLPINPDGVLVKPIYSVVNSGKTKLSSLVGEVLETGTAIEGLSVGDNVIALAPPVPSIALTARDCIKVEREPPVTEDMALWALTMALIPVIHLSELEIGERVLVLSNSLIGRMLADLVWLAGAGSCIGVDPAFANQGDDTSQASPGRNWVKDLTALESIMPSASVDLLIDASGDSAQFLSGLAHVRNVGRAVTIRNHHPARIDFNVYPDLHRRSIKLFNYRTPTSLSELLKGDWQELKLDSQLAFVRHMYETGLLRLPIRNIAPLRSPNNETLIQNQQKAESTLLIEW